MPRVTFAPGVTSSPGLIIFAVDELAFSATVINGPPTSTQLTAQSGSFQFSVQGTGFTYGLVNGEPAFTGGTITGLVVRQSGALQMTITDLGLSAVAFQTAANQENAGTNPAALENLFLGLNWNYVGNSNADVLLATDQTADGIAVNLRGNDTISGGGGNDNFFLGNGNDRAQGGAGNDQFFGGNGNDVIDGDTRADNGSDRLFGGAGNDTLNGGAGNDTAVGGTGNDVLRDEGGTDRFDGGSGVDTILLDSRGLTTSVFTLVANLTTGTQGAVELNGDDDVLLNIENYTYRGDFNMQITGSALQNRLLTDAGVDRVSGLDGNDIIATGSRNDRLDGGRGNDTLDGGSGADRLIGGAGSDRLSGAGGQDTFVFAAGSGADVITDFELLLDRIDILPSMTPVAAQTSGGLRLAFADGSSILLETLDLSDFAQINFI